MEPAGFQNDEQIEHLLLHAAMKSGIRVNRITAQYISCPGPTLSESIYKWMVLDTKFQKSELLDASLLEI